MPYLKSITTGTTFTASTSWHLCDTNSLRSLATTTTVGTGRVYGTAWTPAANYIYLGFILYCSTLNTTAGSTVTIGLFTSAGTTPLTSVTINNSDLVVGYNYVKFTAPYTASTGTQNRIGINTSAGTTVFGTASGTNYTGIMVTNTVQGIAVNDSFFVMGDLTGQGTSTSASITMNNTANTLYGSTGGVSNPSVIGNKGSLVYEYNAGTNYILRLQTILFINGGGTFTMGTQANPIPSNSTAKLEFVCASANQYYLNIVGGTLTTYGVTKTVSAKLAANVAAAATTATTDVSTGWLSGDQLVIPPTNRVATQFDTPTLNGNASGVNLTFNAGLSFAHETTPSTPTSCNIINLTRNVSIFGQGSGFVATNTTYILINGGTVSFNYTQFYYLGNSTTLTTSGLVSNITNANASVSIDGCAIFAPTTFSQYIFYHTSTQSTSTFSCTNTVTYGGFVYVGSGNAALTPSTVTYNNCVFLRSGVILGRLYVTLTNITTAGSTSAGFSFNDAVINTVGSAQFGRVNNLTTYSNTSFGFYFAIPGGGTNTYASGTLSNINAWRNTNQGLYHIGSCPQPLYISGVTLTGNGNANLQLLGSGQIYINNMVTNSQTTYTTPQAILVGSCDKVYIVNSSLGATTPETTSAILGGNNGSVYAATLSLYNTTFGAYSTILSNQSQLPGRSVAYGISSMKHNGVANSTFNWQQFGTITTDSTIYNSSNYSMRMTPTSSVFKMSSQPFKMAIYANDTVTISVTLRKSVVGDGTAYNGNQPILILTPTPFTDSPLNTTLATASGAAGSWETLSATYTPTVTGVYEFILACDGTTGWVNVDNWSTNYVKDTTKMDYWYLGVPDVNINGVPKERSTPFVY